MKDIINTWFTYADSYEADHEECSADAHDNEPGHHERDPARLLNEDQRDKGHQDVDTAHA